MLKREGLGLPMLLLGVVLALLFGAGIMWDASVSAFLYSGEPTDFGKIFAAMGELPAFLLMESAGLMLILRRGKSKKWKDIFFLLGGIAMILQGFLAQIMEMCEDLPSISVADAGLITLAIYVLNWVFTLRLQKNLTREESMRFIFAVLFVCAVSMVAANAVKIPWGRPRMYFLASEPAAEFVPWYRPGTELKKQFVVQGVKADAFRSFPSGHVVTAAGSLLWTLFPFMHPKFEGKGRLLLILSLVWTTLVTLSRLTMGAHFLTDVAFSWFFVWLLYLGSLPLFYRDSKLYLKLYDIFT